MVVEFFAPAKTVPEFSEERGQMSLETARRSQLRVFVSHTPEDAPAIRKLFARLESEGFSLWSDERLLPGEDFDLQIRNALRSSDVILAIFSARTTDKLGYVAKDLRYTLDIADERPEGSAYIIPVRMGPRDLPERLRRWQSIDLFNDDGYSQLLRSLDIRADAKAEDLLQGGTSIHSGGAYPTSNDISISFDEALSADQVKATLTALADYYRKCGGVGLPVEFENQEAVTEEVHA